jgi:hypothetical protein
MHHSLGRSQCRMEELGSNKNSMSIWSIILLVKCTNVVQYHVRAKIARNKDSVPPSQTQLHQAFPSIPKKLDEIDKQEVESTQYDQF